MTEQCLTVGAGKVQLARREGNVAALCDGFGLGCCLFRHNGVQYVYYFLFFFPL